MATQILVLLRRRDRIEQVLPCLEAVCRPGTKVVFFLPFPVESGFCWRNHWFTADSAREVLSEAKEMMDRTSWKVQKDLAEKKTSAAREALNKRGIDVAVDLYTGSVRRMVSDYAADGDAHLIMVGARLPPFLSRATGLFGAFGRPGYLPMLLFHMNIRN